MVAHHAEAVYITTHDPHFSHSLGDKVEDIVPYSLLRYIFPHDYTYRIVCLQEFLWETAAKAVELYILLRMNTK